MHACRLDYVNVTSALATLTHLAIGVQLLLRRALHNQEAQHAHTWPAGDSGVGAWDSSTAPMCAFRSE
jgi:hypothetical protein